MGFQFEWDRVKEAENLKKHGVPFREAMSAFLDPRSVTIHDPMHSRVEDRFVLLGMSIRRRLLVVVHADRGERIRLISARVATRHERKAYEEGEEDRWPV